MANVYSNWDDKKAYARVLMAFQESMKFTPGSHIVTMGNNTQTVFARHINRTAVNAADGTELAATNNTEAGTTLSLDTPLKVWDYVPYDQIASHSQGIIDSTLRQQGSDLAAGVQNRLCANLIKNAGQIVLFDDEDTSTLGTTVSTALKKVVVAFDRANVDQQNRYCFLHPTYFASMWNVAGTRSSDFISGQDNGRAFVEQNFLGLRVRSANMVFATDISADTNYATKYRGDFAQYGAAVSPVWGVAWQADSLAVQYAEEMNVTSADIPDKESVLCRSRVHFGSACPQHADSIIILQGDAGGSGQ